MKNYSNVLKRFGSNAMASVLLLGMVLFSSSQAQAELVTLNLFGDFGDQAGFGNTGLEFGTFSGTFTYDSSADDQFDSDPNQGRYSLSSWSLEFFDASGDLFAQITNSGAADYGEITVSMDPVNPAYIDNIGLEFFDLDNSINQVVLFGVFFDLPNLTSDAIPDDLTVASWVDFGLFVDASGFDETATYVSVASITAVPLPPALMLLVSSLFAFVRVARH